MRYAIDITDNFSYLIVPAHPSDIVTYASREEALNAYINMMIETREQLNRVISSAQKKQRRWDRRLANREGSN